MDSYLCESCRLTPSFSSFPHRVIAPSDRHRVSYTLDSFTMYASPAATSLSSFSPSFVHSSINKPTHIPLGNLQNPAKTPWTTTKKKDTITRVIIRRSLLRINKQTHISGSQAQDYLLQRATKVGHVAVQLYIRIDSHTYYQKGNPWRFLKERKEVNCNKPQPPHPHKISEKKEPSA